MSKAKDKGRRLENMVADYLTDNGIPSQRVPLSGSLQGYPGDVVIGTCEHPTAQIECKNRESMSKQLWEWLEGNDYLVIKRNQCKPLVVMTMEDFVELKK